MNKYIIAVGSSHHNGAHYLNAAQNLIITSNSIKFHGKSRIFKNGSQFTRLNYLFSNCAFALTTSLQPLVFYRELKYIESTLGRIRSYKNSPRTIDLDVLMSFNLEYKSSTFCVPHTQLLARSFFVVCAVEAIMSAGWPLPLALMRARALRGADYMVACP